MNHQETTTVTDPAQLVLRDSYETFCDPLVLDFLQKVWGSSLLLRGFVHVKTDIHIVLFSVLLVNDFENHASFPLHVPLLCYFVNPFWM